jgi:endo-1,4-beta-xylanase
MRAEKFFGCLAAATVAMAIASCTPIVRREGPPGGGGSSGSGGGDPLGGTTGSGGDPGTGGVVETGGTTDTGGVTETGGDTGSGGLSDTGGTTSLGGATETGGVTSSGGVGSGGATASALGGTTSNICGLASSYGWASTQALMDPVSDGSHSLVAIKAPSVVFYDGKYHVFATIIDSTGAATLEHVQFADWPNASSATVDYLDNNPGFKGAYSQPQIFYLKAKGTWYLITQSNGPAYSTNADLAQTAAWTKPVSFYGSTPAVVTQNAGGGIGWTDFWVICDGGNCYLFFTNQKGYLFRAQTSAGSFPNGFGDPVVVMQSSYVYEGSRVYKVSGGTSPYLMLVEGTGGNNLRYIGAWTATTLDGKWTALAEKNDTPFAASLVNVSYVKITWTKDVSHGELVRSGYDETMTVDNCNMRYLYAGRDPYSTVSTALLPWKLGLLVRSK